MKIIDKIETLLIEIESNYPELYQYLDESPVRSTGSNGVSQKDLKEYYEGLRQRLEHYKESHKSN